MTGPIDPPAQVAFLQNIQRIFDEGEFVATYKFALLVALVELAVEQGDDSGAELDLDLHSIAEKFAEQYWMHAVPYSSGRPGGTAAVLVQNNGSQAAVVNHIVRMRARFSTVARARKDPGWAKLIAQVARVIDEMPLWKLQVLRRRHVPFLYERRSGAPGITLLPGVAFHLRRFGPLIQVLARSAWVNHIRSNPRNAGIIGQASDLEAFLFGQSRAGLAAVVELLRDVQENRCFYCETSMRSDPHVDHFVPWSKYPRDLAHNLVLTHSSCNLDKGDMLAGPGHLRRWVQRNQEQGKLLTESISPAGILADMESTTQVARWAYRQAEDVAAQLWVSAKYTVTADNTCLEILGG